MKIIAEFNSTREVLDFINTFGAKVASQITIDGTKVGAKIEDKVIAPVKDEVKVTKETIKAPAEEGGQAKDITEVKETEGIKEVKITKEQVREVFSKLIKAGKQKEAKELTTKYGASKVGEVKEEDYAAILRDAEELL